MNVSSAYWIQVISSMDEGRSITNMIKIKGPKADLWGTPKEKGSEGAGITL